MYARRMHDGNRREACSSKLNNFLILAIKQIRKDGAVKMEGDLWRPAACRWCSARHPRRRRPRPRPGPAAGGGVETRRGASLRPAPAVGENAATPGAIFLRSEGPEKNTSLGGAGIRM